MQTHAPSTQATPVSVCATLGKERRKWDTLDVAYYKQANIAAGKKSIELQIEAANIQMGTIQTDPASPRLLH